ncbi:hypothetical protein [Leifsonia sp. Root112D2]|jgi:TrkA domain protein|uniref:hypothetical protein n=1 Tax=Leifsonia sp. Root112D2 TaxID=1736426 RepID=UPI0006F48AC4|nr:hypothetical protein [Leifsonia sp. Root112D2]KQV06811.1 hypothetical protein ASC63_05360 [Leifsonia sp. Root112D2]
MDITQTTVPGAGVLHDCITRDGQHFRILVDRSGQRELYVYGPTGSEPVATIVLQADEADLVGAIIHSRPLTNRMAELERRVADLAGDTGDGGLTL